MAVYNTYIQQIRFDGDHYTNGIVVDLLKTFNIICQDFPFKKNPKSKDLPTKDWHDEDGLDVYVSETLPMAHYDIDVVFLYVGTEANIRTDLSRFIDFIYGRIKINDDDPVQSARLAVYNEYVGMGRKDIVVSEVVDDIFLISSSDPDAIAKFKVKFTVYDPTTDVTPVRDSLENVTQLRFN